MSRLFARHDQVLQQALEAASRRDYWSAYSEVPSGKIYGETARNDGLAAFEARLAKHFIISGHPSERVVGDEVSPYGLSLGVTYPAASVETLISASQAAAAQWAAADPYKDAGVYADVVVKPFKKVLP